MILIFEQGYEEFDTMGLGEIRPTKCQLHEEQCGAYELELEVPMDEDSAYDKVMNGRVVRVPVPGITTPTIRALNVTVSDVWQTTAAAKVYSKKTTSMGSTQSVSTGVPDPTDIKPGVVKLRGYTDGYTSEQRWVSNGNRILARLASDAEVTLMDDSDDDWYKITTAAGVTGYVQSSKLEFVRTTASAPGDTIQSRKIRDQPFRIYRTEKDTQALVIRAWARHVFYDLMGVALTDCDVAGESITSALALIDAAGTQTDHGFSFLTNSGKHITADYSRRGMVDALINPDDGVTAKANLRLIRDNYDVFFLYRSTTKRKDITYAQNLLGVTVEINSEGIVNRIVPVGTDADGEPLYIDATVVASTRNNASTPLRDKVIEYSEAKVSDTMTEVQAKAKLTELAEDELASGIDLPDISLTVDFIQLGDTTEYQQYRELDRLYMGDLVNIVDLVHGVEAEAEVNEYEYDCLTQRYIKLGVGVTSARQAIGSIGTFMLPNGGVGSSKLPIGGIDGNRLESLSVKTAQIGHAAIGTANIQDLSVTNAKISSAGIDYAKITDLVAETAIFTTGVGGELYLNRLVVNDANVAQLSAGRLVVRGDDGKFYRLSIAEGDVVATETTVDGANISDEGVASVSTRLLWQQATQPAAPFVGMLWYDTTAKQLKRCTATTPAVVWAVVPAGEVHTSVVDVTNTGMTLASTGNINVLAGGSVQIKALGDVANVIQMDSDGIAISTGGALTATSATVAITSGATDATAIAIRNDTDYFLSAGDLTQADAPFWVKKDGSIKASKIQQEYSQSYWDLADSSYPAEFPVYIPAGYTMDTVTFTFVTKKFRSFSKSTVSDGIGATNTGNSGSSLTTDGGTVTMVTGASSGNTATNTANVSGATGGTVAEEGVSHSHTSGTLAAASHAHGLNSHTHSILHEHYIGVHNHLLTSHTHNVGMSYGIYEKSALATSCVLKVNGTTKGTYSPDPASPVEIKANLSAGWNTVTVQPNNDARIAAYLLVKLTPS